VKYLIILQIAACIYIVVTLLEKYSVSFSNKVKGPISFLFIAYMTWALLMCISGVFGLIKITTDYIVQSRQDWHQTNAILTDITPGERIRKDTAENTLTLTYAYVINGTTHTNSTTRVIPADQFVEDEIKKVNDTEKVASIYYDRNNPEATIFGDLPDRFNLPSILFLDLILLFIVWANGRILIRNYKYNFGADADSTNR
jgi:hypothetical protein